MLTEIHKKIYELARPFLNTRKNDVHIEISLDYALKLLEAESGDPDVVIPAVILHDLGWWSVPEEMQLKAFGPKATNLELNRLHETEGVKMAGDILVKVGYDKDKTDEILAIIDGHDSRLEAITQNDQIVKDADKLFRFSPRGFEIDAERFGMARDQLWIRLSKLVEEWFFTPTAKKFAWEALRALEKESN